MSFLLAPSILSADFSRLGEDVTMLHNSAADWIHIDVMDGNFVPNISFGFPVIHSIRSLTNKPFDVHLMITEPQRYISDFKKAGADILTIHYEAVAHLHRAVTEIKAHGMKAGVSLNPHTPVSVLEEIIADLDLVLIMSVNPGFGGQSYIKTSAEKVHKLKQLILQKNSPALIEVDGGINLQNARDLLAAGADVLVAGNSVFKTPDPTETISTFKQIKADTFAV